MLGRRTETPSSSPGRKRGRRIRPWPSVTAIPRTGSRGQRDRRQSLPGLTLPDGVRERLTAGEPSADFGGFSPDGATLLFTRNPVDMTERPYSRPSSTFSTRLPARKTSFGKELGSTVPVSARTARLFSAGRTFGVRRDRPQCPPDRLPNEYDIQAYLFDLADRGRPGRSPGNSIRPSNGPSGRRRQGHPLPDDRRGADAALRLRPRRENVRFRANPAWTSSRGSISPPRAPRAVFVGSSPKLRPVSSSGILNRKNPAAGRPPLPESEIVAGCRDLDIQTGGRRDRRFRRLSPRLRSRPEIPPDR